MYKRPMLIIHYAEDQKLHFSEGLAEMLKFYIWLISA